MSGAGDPRQALGLVFDGLVDDAIEGATVAGAARRAESVGHRLNWNPFKSSATSALSLAAKPSAAKLDLGTKATGSPVLRSSSQIE